MGVFDSVEALKKIWNLVQSNKVTMADLKKAIQSSYRKSHERLGASDVQGYTKKGRFIAIEIKGENDTLSIEQQNFLKDVHDKDGLALVVAENPKKVKFTVWGTQSIPIVAEADFLDFMKVNA